MAELTTAFAADLFESISYSFWTLNPAANWNVLIPGSLSALGIVVRWRPLTRFLCRPLSFPFRVAHRIFACVLP